jgi:hypothetical protein
MPNSPYYDGTWTTPKQQGALQFSFPLQAQTEYYAKEIDREMLSTAASYYPIIGVPQSATNQVLYSDDLTQSSVWTPTAATVQFNAATDPEGLLNASFLGDTVATSSHLVGQPFPASLSGTGGPCSFGVFMKYAGIQYGCLSIQNNLSFSNIAEAVFDLQNGIVYSTIIGTSSIKSVGNGWYWCTVAATNLNILTAVYIGLSVSGSAFQSYSGSGLGIYTCRATFTMPATNLPTPLQYPAIQTTAVTRSVVFPPVDLDTDGNVGDPLSFLTLEGPPSTSQLAKGIADWTRTYDRIPVSQTIPTAYQFTAPSYQATTPAAVPVGAYGYVANVISGNGLTLLNGYYDVPFTVAAVTGTPVTSFTAAGSAFVAGDILLFNNTNVMYLCLVVVSSAGTYTVICQPTTDVTSSALVLIGTVRRLTVNKTDYGQIVGLRAQMLQDYYLPGFTAGVNYFTDIPAESPFTAGGYFAAYAAGALEGSQIITASGPFTVPANVRSLALTLIAGGGGGAAGAGGAGGGGGGGGILQVPILAVVPGQVISCTIGAGGASATNGVNSIFGASVAVGGGRGGAFNVAGSNGGSGGGAGAGAASAGGIGTLGQGNSGGANSGFTAGAGGGGFGSAGVAVASGTIGAAGGTGTAIGGTTYAAGGGGGASGAGAGGAAGGTGAGAGGVAAASGGAGTANTGGGGGGAGSAGAAGGVGGSGAAIITWSAGGAWFNVLSDGLKYWKGAILQRQYTQALLADARGPSGYQKFTANGNFTVPAGITVLRRVVVASGGGGGGYGGGGGGGAGGVILLDNIAVTPNQVIGVVIGAGGAGGTVGSQQGVNGVVSSFSGTSATGGGGGGGPSAAGNTVTPGGAGGGSGGNGGVAGAFLGGSGGGGGGVTNDGGGGGGQFANGGMPGGTTAGPGGAGYTAGGGGGAGPGFAGAGIGGVGLYGNGANGGAVGANGNTPAANTGGGGGGGGTGGGNGGAGGSGFVLVAW